MKETLSDYQKTWEEHSAFSVAEREKQRKQKAAERRQFYCELGKVIQKYRMMRNMSKQTLGIKLGILDTDVYCYESGRRNVPLDLFVKICLILNIDFRFTARFCLAEGEYELLQAFRKRDYKYILSLLAEEI